MYDSHLVQLRKRVDQHGDDIPGHIRWKCLVRRGPAKGRDGGAVQILDEAEMVAIRPTLNEMVAEYREIVYLVARLYLFEELELTTLAGVVPLSGIERKYLCREVLGAGSTGRFEVEERVS